MTATAGVDRLLEWLDARGGVAHSSDARRDGFSSHTMRTAADAGAIRRVRRSWLVAPGCDERRLAAASVSGRVTCVSAAAMNGLWFPRHETIHLVVDRRSARLDPVDATVHWASGPVPMPAHAVIDHPVNVLFHVARCLPRADALAVWESALHCGSVDAAELERVPWRSRTARELASVASSLSDSGLETRFIDLMRSIRVAVRQQVWIDGHPVDGLIGDRLAVQLDGFEHHRSAADRRRDLRADARLALRGYTVLRFDYQQVFFDAGYVTETVRMAIAQGLHRVR